MSKIIVSTPEFEDSPLSDIYHAVRAEVDTRTGRRYPHRVALWLAWESHRRAGGGDLLATVGLPKKVSDFARLIGVSPATIRKYRQRHSELLETSGNTAFDRVLRGYKLSALHALGQSASQPDAKHSSDRRLFFQLSGDLVERQDITSDGDSIMITVDK